MAALPFFPNIRITWGVQEVRGDGKNRRILAFVSLMIDRYQPLVLVIEDWADGACRRCARILTLYAALAELARKKSVQLVRISKQHLHGYFASVIPTTKYEIALAIARRIPAFSFQIPPIRKIWMSEDARQLGPRWACDDAPRDVAFHGIERVGTRDKNYFVAQWLAYAYPCRRFGHVLAGVTARLGANADRYSFIAVDLHHLLPAGLAGAPRPRSGSSGRRVLHH